MTLVTLAGREGRDEIPGVTRRSLTLAPPHIPLPAAELGAAHPDAELVELSGGDVLRSRGTIAGFGLAYLRWIRGGVCQRAGPGVAAANLGTWQLGRDSGTRLASSCVCGRPAALATRDEWSLTRGTAKLATFGRSDSFPLEEGLTADPAQAAGVRSRTRKR